jgi:mRNA interferase MazF
LVSRRVPERGDVFWLEFQPQRGRQQQGRRPAVILSPASYNGKVGLAVLCPVTTQVKGYPFEVLLPEGLPARGAILSDQVKSLDWRSRQARFLCHLPETVTEQVLAKLNTLLRK